MTPSEFLLAQALRMCKMELRGSGRRKLLPPELNQGLLFSFNGHQSIGDYIGLLDELLDAVKLELAESRIAWTIDVALELADLDSVLKHRSTGVIHERLFTGNWKVIEREPGALEEVQMKVALFYDAQVLAFQRWQAMREGLRDLYSTGMGQRSEGDEAEGARGFEWRGTATDAVELALALDVSGLLHFAPQTSQQERIKEVVQKLGVEVAHLDQTLNQLMNRKAGHHTLQDTKPGANRDAGRRRDELRSLADGIFDRETSLGYRDVLQALGEALGVKERQAKVYLSQMQKHGIVTKSGESPARFSLIPLEQPESSSVGMEDSH